MDTGPDTQSLHCDTLKFKPKYQGVLWPILEQRGNLLILLEMSLRSFCLHMFSVSWSSGLRTLTHVDGVPTQDLRMESDRSSPEVSAGDLHVQTSSAPEEGRLLPRGCMAVPIFLAVGWGPLSPSMWLGALAQGTHTASCTASPSRPAGELW